MFSSVLIVDPEPAASRLYSCLIGDRAGRIEYARDGREGLLKLRANPPALLVTEAWLPLLDGYDLCALAHGEPGVLSIMATRLTDPMVRQRAHCSAADVVLAKPIDAQLFEHALEHLRARAARAREQSRRIRGQSRVLGGTARVIHRESIDIWRRPRS
jgi:DNA-binding response OmpR family regulator